MSTVVSRYRRTRWNSNAASAKSDSCDGEGRGFLRDRHVHRRGSAPLAHPKAHLGRRRGTGQVELGAKDRQRAQRADRVKVRKPLLGDGPVLWWGAGLMGSHVLAMSIKTLSTTGEAPLRHQSAPSLNTTHGERPKGLWRLHVHQLAPACRQDDRCPARMGVHGACIQGAPTALCQVPHITQNRCIRRPVTLPT